MLTREDFIITVKIEVAKEHGFLDNLIGNPWEYAMLITHRTKLQLRLYDEVIEAITKLHYKS